MRRGPLLSLAASLALSACAVGPNYTAPVAALSAKAPFVTTTPAAAPERDAEDAWWRLYDDPVLNDLVVQALAANTDVRVALANLQKVQAQLRGARSDLLPQTQTAGSVTRQRYPNWEVLPGAPQEFSSVDSGLNVAYEVDLFGRVRRSIEAAHGDVGAAAADLDAVRVTVAAETTRAYLDALASNERIAAAQDTLRLLDQSLSVTQARFDVGRAERLDLVRLQTLRDQRAATIPPLQAQREGALFRLSALLGRTPRDLPAAAAAQTQLPKLAAPIPVGDGASLIARRPDVRAAERRLAAATARIGVATADLYPRVSLGGSVGITSDTLSNAFTGGNFRYLAGPSIQWAFPNLAGVEARIGASKADTKAALATFDGTVLTALTETETALSAYGRTLQERDALAKARAEAQRSANIALSRQREGAIDFLSVLDAQRTLADAQADLAAADARVAARQVDVFKALGGGWRTAATLSVATK